MKKKKNPTVNFLWDLNCELYTFEFIYNVRKRKQFVILLKFYKSQIEINFKILKSDIKRSDIVVKDQFVLDRILNVI